MPDLPILILLVLGVVLLLLTVLRLFSALRGFSVVRKLFSERLDYGLGTLRARIAALRAALDERKQTRVAKQPRAESTPW